MREGGLTRIARKRARQAEPPAPHLLQLHPTTSNYNIRPVMAMATPTSPAMTPMTGNIIFFEMK